MNEILDKFARDRIKSQIAKLPESNHMLFKRMYSSDDLTLDINRVIDLMPEDRLDWAMQQVDRTLAKAN